MGFFVLRQEPRLDIGELVVQGSEMTQWQMNTDSEETLKQKIAISVAPQMLRNLETFYVLDDLQNLARSVAPQMLKTLATFCVLNIVLKLVISATTLMMTHEGEMYANDHWVKIITKESQQL